MGGYLFLFPLMRLRGISIAAAVQQLSVLVPITFAMVVWGERPQGVQAVGALLALASLPLLTIRPGQSRFDRAALPPQDRARERRRNLVLLAGVFLVNGCGALAMRGFQQVGPADEETLYLAILFSVAALVSLAAWWPHRRPASRRDLLPGVVLGVINAFSGIALLGALQRLPAWWCSPSRAPSACWW